MLEGKLGLNMDCLLVGRLDGSLALINVYDYSTMKRLELEHCSRKDGKYIWFAFAVKWSHLKIVTVYFKDNIWHKHNGGLMPAILGVSFAAAQSRLYCSKS